MASKACRIPSATSVDDLRCAIQNAWNALPIEAIDHQIDQMPDRVWAVLKEKGGHTRFEYGDG